MKICHSEASRDPLPLLLLLTILTSLSTLLLAQIPGFFVIAQMIGCTSVLLTILTIKVLLMKAHHLS